MKKGAIIGIVCGVLALGFGAIGVSAAVIFSNPTVKVMQGTTKMLKEMTDQESSLNARMGVSGKTKILTSDKYKTVFDLDIYDVEGLEDLALGIDGTVLCDYKNEKMKEEISFSLSYFEFLSFQMAVDKTDVYLDIPKLYDGSVYFNSQNIDEQFNNSIFKDYIETELEEDISMDFFSEAAGNTANFSDEYKKEIIQLVKNAEIEKTKMVLPIEVGNKSVNCEGYTLSLKQEDVNSLLQSLYEESGVSGESTYLVSNDVKILIYMDKSNNIKQIQTEEDIYLKDLECGISAALKFTGEDNAFDEMKGKFGVVADGETVNCDLEYASVLEGKETKQKMQMIISTDETDIMGIEYKGILNAEDSSYDMDISMDVEDENITVELAGNIEADDKSYALNFKDCVVYYEDSQIGSFDGGYRIEPLEEEIEIPSAKTYPIFEFTEAEFASFAMECYENLEEYANMLGGMGNLY